MTDRSRRSFLAAAGSLGAAALAGCSFSLGDADPSLSFTLSTDSVGTSLAPAALWSPPENPSPLSRHTADRVADTLAGERPTTYGYRPVPEGEYVERDGAYYELQVVATDLREIDRPVLRADWVGDVEQLEDPPEYVRRADLPPLDRRAVNAAYLAARAEEFDGGAPWHIVERGGYVYRRLDVAESELAPDPQHSHVAFNGTLLALSVDVVAIEEPAYTGDAVRVAGSKAAFERALDADLVDARIDESDLSDEQQRILARGSYEETTPLSDAYRSLLEALQFRDLLHTNPSRAPRGKNGQHLALGDRYYRYGLYVNPVD